MRTIDTPSDKRVRDKRDRKEEEQAAADSVAPPMAVSIAGVSTACSKDALVTSAKAVREALSTD